MTLPSLPAPEPRGVALACEPTGLVAQVFRDDFHLPFRPGGPFRAAVDPGSAAKADRLLDALRRDHAAFDWELNVPGPTGLVTLHFAGCAWAGGLLLVAAPSASDMQQCLQELAIMNNEQANALRAALKDLSLGDRDRSARDAPLFDELTRLNNELVTAQRELARQNRELERLNEEKNRVLGVAAHDLRSPLASITMFSDFLLDEAAPALTPQQVEFLGLIRAGSTQMLSLVDKLLDVSRIEAGHLDLDRRATDLVALLRHRMALLRPLAEKRGIALTLHVDAPLPPLALDADHFAQVIDNLLNNAVKFSPGGAAVEVRLASRDGRAVLSVQDHGCGIPADRRGLLFRPFSRVGSRAPGGETSTGLGLSIVRKVVEAHGGTVGVDSEPGRGSTFHVSLPLA